MTWGLVRDYEPISESPDGMHIAKRPHRKGGSFSAKNHEVLADMLEKTAGSGQVVMEIGVDRDPPSSTSTILNNLHGRYYLGVDIEDKSHLDGVGTRTVRCCSRQDMKVLRQLAEFAGADWLNPISLLHIDGCHRTDVVWNDWSYALLVAVGGAVVIHDTRVFRGPRLLAQAIDPRYFEVEFHCDDDPTDWGIATARRVR